MTSDLPAAPLLALSLLLSACAAPLPAPRPACAPAADPLAVAGAELLVARFLSAVEGPDAAAAMAGTYRLDAAQSCGGALRLRYLPRPGAAAPPFGGAALVFAVDPGAARVTWAFDGG